MDLNTFKDLLVSHFNETVYELKDIDLFKSESLINNYRSYSWNYGESPTFTINKWFKSYSINIIVEKGLISQYSLSFNNIPLKKQYLNKPFHPNTFNDDLDLKYILFEWKKVDLFFIRFYFLGCSSKFAQLLFFIHGLVCQSLPVRLQMSIHLMLDEDELKLLFHRQLLLLASQPRIH